MRKSIIVIIILLAVASMFSCSSSGYKRITENKEGIKFSFEYPLSYQENKNPDNENDFSVILSRYDDESESLEFRNINTSFAVIIYEPSEEEPDAKSFLDNKLLKLSKLPVYQEYKLLERSTIMVSGINSEFILFSGRALMSGDYLDSKISYVRDIYLDYKKKIVNIGVICYPQVNDQVKEEFENILKSFKFFN
jgi:hypothetical protein